MTGLIELAARVEAAEGPGRELDALIASALGWREVPNPTFAGGLVGRWYRADGTLTDHYGVPHFTASLDAAMTLAGGDPYGVLFEAMVRCPGSETDAAAFLRALPRHVTAAALRAHAAQGARP